MDDSFSRWRPHPWHGLSPGPGAPSVVTAFVEITPFDLIKYEIDKSTGFLKVDRPQVYSSLPPTVYGFIPRTYDAARVAALMPDAADGDRDPLDICVVSSHPISRAEIILQARVVGGIPMLDNQTADDKIVAVLEKDDVWNKVNDIGDLPSSIVDRLIHYFGTYKNLPNSPSSVRVGRPYGRSHAETVIHAALADYREHFGTP